MKPKTLFSLLLVLFLCLNAGPTVFATGEDWKPIDPAQLALKTSVVERDADAEAIFWEVRVDDSPDGDLILTHYIRIKVFTDRGRESQRRRRQDNDSAQRGWVCRTARKTGTDG